MSYHIIVFIQKFNKKNNFSLKYLGKNSENSTFSYGIEWREVKEGSMNIQIGTVSSLLCIEGMW